MYDELDWYKAKICGTRCTGLDWGDRTEIEAALATDEDDENEVEVEDTREKARRLKKEKQRLKRAAEKKAIRQREVQVARDKLDSPPPSSPPGSPSASFRPGAGTSAPLHRGPSSPGLSFLSDNPTSSPGLSSPLFPSSPFPFPLRRLSPSGRVVTPVAFSDTLVGSSNTPLGSYRHPHLAARHTPISTSPVRVFLPPRRDLKRSTSLPPDDYLVENLVSPLETTRKRSRNEVDETNRKKLRYQPMATTREEETVRLMFSCCGCTPEIKLNNEWQMSIMSKNVCVVDGIASLGALHWVENFKPCDKHFRLLAKKVGIVTKNVPVVTLASRLDEVWKNRKLIKLGQLVHENKAWFGETLQWAITEKVTE